MERGVCVYFRQLFYFSVLSSVGAPFFLSLSVSNFPPVALVSRWPDRLTGRKTITFFQLAFVS